MRNQENFTLDYGMADPIVKDRYDIASAGFL